ncbi:hypothetical protein E5S69_14750 [Cupriavidus necator]|uniref:hypothetical protein n=1 Tax=Cupriavidus necator TaxID=106590 RepID=UPI0014904F7A|nr:hypothetical protein [Cupriavidus necator]NOV24766.1 hypothetical protein [Cupriavidus necator]
MPTATALQATQARQTQVEEWRVLETYRGERHLVGRFSSTGKYWAGPPIVRWDSASRTAFTSDGWQLLLVGEPGAPAEAERFISLCAVFDERLLTTKDVTAEFLSHWRMPRQNGAKQTLPNIRPQSPGVLQLSRRARSFPLPTS